MTYPAQPQQPYTPFATTSPLRAHYLSRVEVLRTSMKIIRGQPTLTWSTLTAIIDPFMDIAGQMMCRLELGFIKRGDMPMPIVAGRAPDRVGTVYFDSAIDPDTGAPYVLAGDRLKCIGGPITGIFELRTIPTAAVNMTGAHHIECQVFEVAQSLGKTSTTPFPGSEGPDT